MPPAAAGMALPRERLEKAAGEKFLDRRPDVDTLRIYMQAVAYIRVSTLGQVQDGVSLDTQRAKIAAWCSLNDYELVLTFEDAGISGASADRRPGLQRALDAACSRKAALIVHSLSRLARSTVDALTISQRLHRAGAELVSLSEKLDTTTSAGKMVFRMLAVLAEFERDQIAERTRAAMQHLRRLGKRISRYAPFGWDLSPDGDVLTPNEAEQEVIRVVVRLRIEGLTLRGIADELEIRGIPTKLGGRRWSAKVLRDLILRQGTAA